jgi:hypothetical protein
MLCNVESDNYRNRNVRDERMKKLLEELIIEGLTTDCVRREVKMIKRYAAGE